MAGRRKPSTGGSKSVRGAELAALAGMSVQQVRNYEAVALLPPAERTAAGYRIFSENHRRAVPPARALVRSYGWDAAVAIMSAIHAGDLRRVVELIDRGHARLDQERERIQRALRAFETVVTNPLDSDPRLQAALELIGQQNAPLRVGQLATLLGVRTSALRFWERAELIRSERDRTTGYRTYDRTAVRDAHLVHLLREGNFPTTIIRAALAEMHSSQDGRPVRVGAELGRRDRELHERSWRQLRADAAVTEYVEYLGLRL